VQSELGAGSWKREVGDSGIWLVPASPCLRVHQRSAGVGPSQAHPMIHFVSLPHSTIRFHPPAALLHPWFQPAALSPRSLLPAPCSSRSDRTKRSYSFFSAHSSQFTIFLTCPAFNSLYYCRLWQTPVSRRTRTAQKSRGIPA
jgi:hypothetical protein